MIMCQKCGAEMVCVKNGVGVDFGNGHVYAGDRYECRSCHSSVVNTTGTPVFDPGHSLFRDYLWAGKGSGRPVAA